MSQISYHILEGVYLKVDPPQSHETMVCPRCKGSKGHVCHEKDDIYSWFCLTDECVQRDAQAAKKKVREKSVRRLREEQRTAENAAAVIQGRRPDYKFVVGEI